MTWTVLEANGLHTTANPLSAVPRGALRKADNVVIRSKDVIEPRRGQKPYPSTFGASPLRANEIFCQAAYDHFSALVYTNTGKLYLVGSSDLATAVSGNYDPADIWLRMKFAEFNETTYFASLAGLMAVDTPNIVAPGTPRAAGIPKPSGVETRWSVYDFGAVESNWLPDDSAVAIRALFGKRDDETLTLGPPSERAHVKNSAGANRAVKVTVDIPDNITSEHFVRIYMSETVADTVDPGEDLWLVFERQLSSAEVVAGVVDLTLTTVESILSDVALYTSPNEGKGIAASKLPPPFAKDICRWRGRLWGFNIARAHAIRLTILGLSSGSGSDESRGIYDYSDPTIDINGTLYIFNPSNDQTGDAVSGAEGNGIRVRTTVYPSGTASQQIEDAAKQLTIAINMSDPDLVAYFVAKPDGWPGEVVIEKRSPGADSFTAQQVTTGVPAGQGVGQAFAPNIVEAVSSLNGAQGHGFACSDVDEPESWPLFNYGAAGNKGSYVVRGIPLRDGIFCFMSDGTIQVISGSAPPYRVDELDSTAKLIAPDTAKVLNNQIWALTNQGVVTVSEAGVGIIGLPIEVDIRALSASAALRANVRIASFAVAYETERSYMLCVPSDASGPPSQCFLYNYATKSWVRWPMSRTCGAVDPTTDMLLMGDGLGNAIQIERKTLTDSDNLDDEVAITIVSSAEDVVTVDSTEGVEVGDGLLQSGLGYRGVVSEVIDETHLRIADLPHLVWEAGAAAIGKAIPCEVQWTPSALGAPGLLKNLGNLSLHFWGLACEKAEAFICTDTSAEWSRTKLMTRESDAVMLERTGVSPQKSSGSVVSTRFTIREAFSAWKLLGYTLESEVVSDRTKK